MKKTYLNILGGIVVVFLLFSVNANSVIEGNAEIVKETISQEDKPAIVYIYKFDPDKKRAVKEPIAKLTLDEVEQLKYELQNIQREYKTSVEQIQQQLKVMYKWNLISDDVYTYLENLVSSFNNISNPIPSIYNTPPSFGSSISPGVIICGPSLVSFLSIGGSILPLQDLLFHNILAPLWRANLNDTHLPFLNGTRIQPFLGIMPAVIFLGLSMTLINVIGVKIGPSIVLSPFLAILAPHASFGISVSIFEKSYPVNVLDWSIGISGIGLISYFYS
ncbi:MAG: hypothetical protein DRN12_02440 [Thermoplasmata archaeon]|nr:MAG: hypothetical protein DRN12_02440 [Thermoplasmata archaeon]